MTIQKLTSRQKTISGYFNRILEISDSCYSGVERPLPAVLLAAYTSGDVYIAYKTFADFTEHIIGFAIVMDGPSPLLWSIAVEEGHRGGGIATALLMEVEKETRAAAPFSGRTVRLTVNVNNVPAIKLYLDAGYRIYNISRRHYQEAGDGLVMRKTLEGK